MRSRVVYIILLVVLMCTGRGANAQLLLRGYVLSATGGERLSMVNITIYPAMRRYVSNRYGAFSFIVNQTDTLQFSIIGFETLRVPLHVHALGNPDTIIRVYLKPVTYKLNPLDVRKRKNDSLARHYAQVMKTDSTLNNYDKLKYWPKAMSLHFDSGITLRGPITALWYKYSDRGKEIARTLELIRLYQQQQKVDEKYNVVFVKQVTGLDNEGSVALMNRCRLPDEFVLRATEYELGIAVKNCLLALH